jgi:hypothetical protein
MMTRGEVVYIAHVMGIDDGDCVWLTFDLPNELKPVTKSRAVAMTQRAELL